MILTILKYPDPILSQPGEPVTEFNAELETGRRHVRDNLRLAGHRIGGPASRCFKTAYRHRLEHGQKTCGRSSC